MPATALDHYNVFCRDLQKTVAFYERYVGLRTGDRPPFSFPGAWLYAGDKAVLHLVAESGRHEVNGLELDARDGLRIAEADKIAVRAIEDGRIVFFDLP